ncbi:MAG: tRNA modification GTPase [Clostridiales bacterium]|nr:tRNA modification GTPase [Clostridiales bacterium]
MYMDDTIAAISTPIGIGGIGIIRISGKDAIDIVDKIFKSPKGKRLTEVKSHTIHYGHVVHLNTDKVIDEVLVSVMKEPHTFTRENIVEINCHGGIVSTRNVLEEVLNTGARLADPGEFTKRAFLNGRIDLVQAEAIIDVINSKTNIGLESAIDQLEGNLSKKIFEIRTKLIHLAAHLQAAVDFPEDDIEELSEENLINSLESIMKEMDHLIKTADMGKIIREGLSTVIVGKPNVGKSSLLNALVRENRAIVTEIPGTTRDIIEEYINIKGVPLKVVDTAGIRETEDIVERIGVEKSKEFINKADLVILILDGSEALSENDKNIIDLVIGKKAIVLINKADLTTKIDTQYIREIFKNDKVIDISVKDGTGLEELENTIYDMFFEGDINLKDDVIVTNLRHKDSLVKASQNLQESIQALKIGMPVDMVSIDIKNSIEALGEIIGQTVSEEIVDQIFRNFCLGK